MQARPHQLHCQSHACSELGNSALGTPAVIQQPGKGVACHQVAVPEDTRAWHAPTVWWVLAPYSPHKDLHPHLSYFGIESLVWQGSSGQCQPCVLLKKSVQNSVLYVQTTYPFIQDMGWVSNYSEKPIPLQLGEISSKYILANLK